jgi:hypothetical protein
MIGVFFIFDVEVQLKGCSLGTTLSVDPEALPVTSLLVGQQDSVAASP